MDKPRLSLPDMARGVGVLLVILSHLEAVRPEVLGWISTFHMPLFFILSGVTMSLWTERTEGFREQLRSRSGALLVPYFWFSLLYFLLDIGNLLLGKINGRRFYENAMASVTFCGKSVLWYVSALLLSQILLLILLRIRKKPLRAAAILLIAGACVGLSYPWRALEGSVSSPVWVPILDLTRALLRAGIVLPFVAVSRVCTKAIRERKLSGGRIVRLLIGLTALAASILISRYHWSDTNNLYLGNPLLYYAGGIAGSVAVIALLSLLPELPILSRIGRDSLVILAVHLDCYVLWAGTKAAQAVMKLWPSGFIYVTVTVAVTVILGSFAARVIERYFPFVMRPGNRRARKDSEG